MSETKKFQLFWILIPLIVCVVIMLPRLISPQFGMFDDGNTLTTSSRIVSGDLSLNYESERGRFRPMYWLMPAVVYLFAGNHPFWYFLANQILLILIVLFTTAFLRRLGMSARKSALMGILFILTGSTLENFYTFSKGEPLMLLFIVLALWSTVKLYSETVSTKSLLLRSLLATAYLFLADISKETALVLLPITAGWLVLELVAARLSHRKSHWKWVGSLFAASLVSFAVYWLVRNSLVTTSLQTGSYTAGYSFTLAAFKASLIRWTGWLLRDEFFLLPLALFWIISSIKARKANHWLEVLGLLVWLAGWIAVYLPWRFAQEYYLLPFDLGISVLTILLASHAWQRLKENGTGMSITAGVLLVLAAILWVVSLPNHVTDARIQLAVDSANNRMLDLMEKIPPGSRVLVNIQSANEYSVELGLLLQQVRGRTDIHLEPFRPNQPASTDFYLTPFVHNRPLLTFRMGVIEDSQTAWVNSLQAYLGPDAISLWRVERRLLLLVVDLPRLFCPLLPTLNFCAAPRPLIDTQTFSYGWMLYPAKP